MKVFYKKQKPTTIPYCSHKHISNEAFFPDVQNRISQMTSENNDLGLYCKATFNEAA